MGKKKKSAVEAFDKQGPATLAEGYTWYPECQASFQGEVCPGCVDLSGAGTEAPPAGCPACKVEPGGTILISEDGKCLACGRDVVETDPTTPAEAAEQASTEITTITEILPVPLTDAEYKEFGILVSRANQEIAQAEDELKSVKSQYKSRIDSAEARRNEYAAIINAGHQQRQVECTLFKDFRDNTISLIRGDTGEVVRTRTMSQVGGAVNMGAKYWRHPYFYE
jgi:hypothetical protein